MINLYYDTLVDDTVPVPNGSKIWQCANNTSRIPKATDSHLIVHEYTYFFNCIKALGSPFELFTAKEDCNNLFYPLELNPLALKEDENILDYIPTKSIKRISKGKMKMLLLMPTISHDYRYLWKLRRTIDNLTGLGIPREQIYIVLGDINQTYRKLLNTKNLFGIDWNQIYMQIALKSRYNIENLRWVFNNEFASWPGEEKLKAEQFDIDNWNPKRLYSAFTGKANLHNTCFVSDLKYYGLDTLGKYSYNIGYNDINHNFKDFRITDKTKGEEFIERKKHYVKNLSKKTVIMDMTTAQRRVDGQYVNKSLYEDSVINIISDSWMPMLDENYLDETNVLAPGKMIWLQIAKAHPFMVLGCLNTINYIMNQGYFSSNFLVNEDYDRVTSITKTSEMICDNLKMLNECDTKELKDKMEFIKPYLKKNKEKFFERPNKRKFNLLFEEMKYE